MPHVSPSQQSTWIDCPRWWAYSRQRPKSSNRYAAFGERAHAHGENWLHYGTPPDPRTPEGRCIMAGLHYLPMPGTAIVEYKFDAVFGGVEYTGRIDFLYGFEPGRIIVIGDHKTTGSLDYMKRVGHENPDKDLRWDPQWIIYSHWAAETFDVPYVAGHWQYYRRDPKAVPSTILEDRDTIARKFWIMHERVSLPIIQGHGRPPEEFPRNLKSCNKYGGCPHRHECLQGVSVFDRVAAL